VGAIERLPGRERGKHGSRSDLKARSLA
jgi:hypothetical protein